jgi:hypothetical protein
MGTAVGIYDGKNSGGGKMKGLADELDKIAA